MQRLNKDNNALRGTHHPGKCTVSKINFSTRLISKNVEYCEALGFMPTNLRFVSH